MQTCGKQDFSKFGSDRNMKVCPKCGYRENVPWIGSRFEFNGQYIRFDEAENYPELNEIVERLKEKENHERIIVGPFSYYRCGTGGLYLYRQPNEDFRVPRERKNHSEAEK